MNKILKNFNNINYGPALEDSKEVIAWIKKLSSSNKNYIDGKWISSKSTKKIQVINPSNIYFTYFNGLAYKASGNSNKAKELFKEVATHNFNGLNYTVVRNKAIKEIEKG